MKNSKEIKINVDVKLDDLVYILIAIGILLLISAFVPTWIIGVAFIITGAFSYILGKYNEVM